MGEKCQKLTEPEWFEDGGAPFQEGAEKFTAVGLSGHHRVRQRKKVNHFSMPKISL